MNSFYKFMLGALESKVEDFVGERAFAEIYKTREEKELKEILLTKARAAEKRWLAEYPERDFTAVVRDAPLADLPSVQNALWKMTSRPDTKALASAVQTQLQSIMPPRFSEYSEEAA